VRSDAAAAHVGMTWAVVAEAGALVELLYLSQLTALREVCRPPSLPLAVSSV
jgi:hypothetical protein